MNRALTRRGRQRARALARGLALPDPFDVIELCRRVGHDGGRPIELVALPLGGLGPCGLWLATASTDLICYERFTSRPHQQHIVLHELAHILGGHGGPERLDAIVADLVPQLSADTLKIMFARQHASHLNADEREAEVFAYSVMRRVGRRPRRWAQAEDDPENRIRTVFEG